jgi:hypothetical protein
MSVGRTDRIAPSQGGQPKAAADSTTSVTGANSATATKHVAKRCCSGKFMGNNVAQHASACSQWGHFMSLKWMFAQQDKFGRFGT